MKLSKEIKRVMQSVLQEKLAHAKESGVIVSSHPLTQEEITHIQEKIHLLHNLPVSVEIDESLIAGFIVKVGSKRIDYSLNSKIKSLFASL